MTGAFPAEHAAGQLRFIPGVVALVGGAAALLGVYWDDAWHTDRGRDSALSPPHVLLYAGILVVLAAIAAWAWTTYRGGGRSAVLGDAALGVAAAGALVTIVSAPIDDFWHRAFRRDAVLWSPPHMLGIVATLVLATGIAAGLRGSADPRARLLVDPGRALVLGAALVAVMEYEADVPQFSVVWYLPVTVGAIAVASLLMGADARGWPLARAAIWCAALRLLVVGVLAALGHSLPAVPPVLLSMVMLDLTRRRGWSPTSRGLALAGVTVASYELVRAVVPLGVDVPQSLVPTAFVFAAGVGIAIFGLADVPTRPAALTAGALAVVVLSSLALHARPALAHDPGQGEQIGSVRLSLTVREETTDEALVEARVLDRGECRRFHPQGLVARRAGMVRRAPLVAVGSCRVAGTVAMPADGRWFVYVEFAREPPGVESQAVEAWLDVESGAAGARVANRPLYVPSPEEWGVGAWVAGVLLYGVSAVLLVSALRLIVWTDRTSRTTTSKTRR